MQSLGKNVVNKIFFCLIIGCLPYFAWRLLKIQLPLFKNIEIGWGNVILFQATLSKGYLAPQGKDISSLWLRRFRSSAGV